MHRPNLFVLTLVILLLNAGISMALISKSNGTDKDGFFSKKERAAANDQLSNNRHNAITETVQAVEPAVVSVNVIKTEIVRGGMGGFGGLGFPFGDFFGGTPMQRQVQSLGSGVIYDKDGHIITNAHVVSGATQIKVVLPDAREFDAKLIGIDEASDIAILQISGKDIPLAKLGTSSDLIIGEWAVALGNPYGFLMNDTKPSVAVGVISAVKRNFGQRQDGKTYKDMIQTDAAINQGNSGGPLVNINGEVIGINTFIMSESGGSVGIGFALPIDRVKRVAKEIIAYKKIRPVNFSFKVQEITKELAGYFDVPENSGVLVTELKNDSPAYKAGLRNRDVITKVNGAAILSGNDIRLAVADILVDDEVTFVLVRDSKTLTIKYTAKE